MLRPTVVSQQIPSHTAELFQTHINRLVVGDVGIWSIKRVSAFTHLPPRCRAEKCLFMNHGMCTEAMHALIRSSLLVKSDTARRLNGRGQIPIT